MKDMKKFVKYIAAVALLVGVSTAARAQEGVEEFYPYSFISVQGGAQATLTHYDMSKLITPQVGLSFGRYFNSKVGARLHLQGLQIKSGFKQDRYDGLTADMPYKFNALTADLDLLVNLSNVINPNRQTNHWNWNLILGWGVNYSWDYDEYNDIIRNNYYVIAPEQCGTKHSSFNGRIGTQIERSLGRHFAVNLEVDANGKNDIFNLKTNDHVDWQVAAFLGLTYKFGMKKAQPKPEPAPVVEEVVEEYVAPVEPAKPVVVEKKPEPKPVVKEEPLKETLYYEIRITDPNSDTEINKVAEWCKKYPEKMITVSGYADKGTGNPRINAKYAAQRADKVAKQLQKKGIPASRITIQSYGDTVQPFADNDSNRCVIVVGE